MTDTELAAHLAQVAGRILLEVRSSGMFEGKALGKAGDQTANQFLMHALQAQRPDDGLLSEESKDTEERGIAAPLWPSPKRMACIARASTDRRYSTIKRTPICQICSSAAQNWRKKR